MRIRKKWPADVALQDEEILLAAKISDALAHPVRIRMLRYILSENSARRTVTNKDLVLVFGYAQATVSQHISKLLIGGLLDMRKKGTSSCYFARIGRLSSYMDTLKKFDTPENVREMPDFLRSALFEQDDTSADNDGELHPEDLALRKKMSTEDMPRYL